MRGALLALLLALLPRCRCCCQVADAAAKLQLPRICPLAAAVVVGMVLLLRAFPASLTVFISPVSGWLPRLTPSPPLPIRSVCRAFKPDIIHCSSPGIMWLAALIYSRLLKAPLVYSYHTHVPEYMPR